MTKHVVVLKGGLSAEREVSLVSGAACAKALRELGYRVTELDAAGDIASELQKLKPDVVFNALHGRYGEDGCVQGLLELLKIPYTHSGVLASAVAMDKPMAKRVFASVGLRCPKGMTVSREDMLKGDPMPRPYVAKPANEGSSVGVKIVQEGDNFYFTAENWTYGDSVLVEEYIPGREITVAVLNGKALGVTEIRPLDGFYDYENKYTDGKTEHLCPAPISEAQAKEAMDMAVAAHHVLGCRGLSRSDFRLDDTKGGSRIFLLEVNTQPGMTPLSLSPELAAYAGISFNNLVQMLIDDARLGE
ncbi:MAG: D-alanine--D-alanine ligase [Proteobacteria bacterium]|nr:D-alanine--D-alanine ligase [Pseudomonadota bacterium]